MCKKTVAIMLAGALAVSAAGCGQSAPEETPAGAVNETAAQDAREDGESEAESEAEASAKGWMTPYEDTVEVTVAREAVNYEFPEGDDITDNIWTRAFYDALNIDVVTDWVSDEYYTKLNLAIASGDLPDVFVVKDVQLQQLMDAGQIADITEVYENYASETLKRFMDTEASIFNTAKKDGRLYAIPRLYSGYHPQLLWLRNDWMEQLGKEAPATVEELEEILLGMKDISGGYSLAVGQDLDGLYRMGLAWNAYPGMWVEAENGEIIYGSIAPQMKDALKKWSEWYQKGIIKSDFATMNLDAVKQDIVNGESGAQIWQSSWGWVFGVDELKNQDIDAYFLPYEIPTATGEKAVYPRTFNNNGYIVVNKNCTNPEAVIKLIDYYVYMINDAYPSGDMPSEVTTQFTANNMQHVTGPFTVTNSTDDYGRWAMVAEARDTGDESVLQTSIAVEVYEGTMKWINEKDPASIGYALQFGLPGSGVEIANGVINEGRVLESRLWGPSPQELLDYGSTLDDILLEGYTKIIMGVENIDYFDTLVEQWYSAGGQSVTDAVNAMYNQ